MSDRFDSREDIQWAQGPYDDGYQARSVYGASLTDCPTQEVLGLWAWKSWRAGWADADQSLSEEEKK